MLLDGCLILLLSLQQSIKDSQEWEEESSYSGSGVTEFLVTVFACVCCSIACAGPTSTVQDGVSLGSGASWLVALDSRRSVLFADGLIGALSPLGGLRVPLPVVTLEGVGSHKFVAVFSVTGFAVGVHLNVVTGGTVATSITWCVGSPANVVSEDGHLAILGGAVSEQCQSCGFSSGS